MSVCDVSVVWAVAGGLGGAAGGQGTLWCFIKACGAVADMSRDKAPPCLRQCDHQMVCIEWMPRSPRGLHTHTRNVTGCLSYSSYITLRPCSGSSDKGKNSKYLVIACTCLLQHHYILICHINTHETAVQIHFSLYLIISILSLAFKSC